MKQNVSRKLIFQLNSEQTTSHFYIDVLLKKDKNIVSIELLINGTHLFLKIAEAIVKTRISVLVALKRDRPLKIH